MEQVLELYDKCPVFYRPHEAPDPKNLVNGINMSSICKNKAMVYKHRIENYPEFFYEEGKEAKYEKNLETLSHWVDALVRNLNEAQYHGEKQSAAWHWKLLEFSSIISDNRLVKYVLR